MLMYVSDLTFVDGRIQCRDCLLSMLPKILASVSNQWRVHQKRDNSKVCTTELNIVLSNGSMI